MVWVWVRATTAPVTSLEGGESGSIGGEGGDDIRAFGSNFGSNMKKYMGAARRGEVESLRGERERDGTGLASATRRGAVPAAKGGIL